MGERAVTGTLVRGRRRFILLGGDSFFSVVETKGGFGEGVGMGFFMEEW